MNKRGNNNFTCFRTVRVLTLMVFTLLFLPSYAIAQGVDAIPLFVLNAGIFNGISLIAIILLILLIFIVSLLVYLNQRSTKAIKGLIQEQKMRDARNLQILDQFFASISYDIRTPLNGIVGSTELLKRDKDPVNTEKFLNILSVASTNLCTTVTDLIDFTRFGNKDLKLESNVFNIHELMGELVDLHYHKAAVKKVRLNLSIDKKIPVLLTGDQGKLRQIVMTFLRLGIKNSENGTFSLGCDLIRTSGNVVEIRFRFLDTGSVYTDKQIEAFLFSKPEDFNYIDFLDADSPGRFALARNIIEMMGGSCGIESKAASGNQYWFTCNLDKAPDNKTSVTQQQMSLAGMNVLIVDDDMTSRALIRQYLGYYNCHGIEQTNISDSRTYLNSDNNLPIHAIIISLPITTISQMEMIHDLSHPKGKKKIPIIYISNEGSVFSATDINKYGFHTLLSKPVRVLDLYYSLQELSPKTFAQPSDMKMVMDEGKRFKGDILLVEDDLISEKVANATLSRLGFKVDIAVNGKAAVQKYIDKPYEFIFMDIMMPELNGLQATRQIREFEKMHPERKRVIIIALTAETVSVTRDQCIEAGMNDYISKPFRIEELQKVLSL